MDREIERERQRHRDGERERESARRERERDRAIERERAFVPSLPASLCWGWLEPLHSCPFFPGLDLPTI